MDVLFGDDEFTGLYDADLPRADLVQAPANGVDEWIVMKDADGEAGLLDPEFVRDLIGKQAEPEPSGRERVQMPNGVTLTGSPAAMAAFIHKASVRAEGDGNDVAKAEMSGKSQNDLPDSAFAYIEPGGKKDEDGKTTPRSLRHFPIHDAAHVRNALSRAPQSPFGDKAMPKIRAAARKFGIEVSKEEAAVAETVTKDMSGAMAPELDDGIDGLDPTVPLAAPDEDAPGNPAEPGSPAWEAIDAATAQKWVAIAARLKNALCILSERELLEAASADPDDAEHAWNLEDAMCAVDYVISTLAVFAAGEQAEADLGCEAMDAIGKAMTAEGLPASLDTVEGLSAVAKAGRVLSAANEAHIRDAAQALNTVLSSLPKAPLTDDGQPVAKEGTPVEGTQPAPESGPDTAQVAKDTAPAGTQAAPGDTAAAPAGETRAVAKASDGLRVAVYDRAGALCLVPPDAITTAIAKADGDEKAPMQAVFDQDGDLIGVVDPAAIQPVAGTGKKADTEPEAEPAPDGDDMTPAPAAETGTPADAVADDGTVAKQDQDADVYAVLKSAIAEAVAGAIGSVQPAEDVAKQADVAAL